MNSAKKIRQLTKLINGTNKNYCNENCNRRSYSVSVSNRKVNDEFVLRSSLESYTIPSNASVLDRLFRDLSKFHKHVAIECSETGKKYTYEELVANIGRFGTSLRSKLGLQTKDVVAVILPNCPEYPVVAYGTIKSGLIVTSFNPAYKEHEITHQLKLTQPKVIVTIDECYQTVVNSLEQIKATAKIIIVDKPSDSIPEGSIRFTEIAETGPIDTQLLDAVDVKHNDLSFIQFSSGTTGLPKGVEITNSNVLAAIETVVNDVVGLARTSTATHQDVVPCVLPFFHIFGLMVVMTGHMVKGAKLVTMPKFNTQNYLDVLKNHKASLLYVVPPLALFLSKHPDVKTEHLESVKYLLCGAAPLGSSDILPLLEKTKGKMSINQGYGATETTSMGSVSLPDYNPDYSSSGQPMSNVELKFTDPLTGGPVPIGSEGEILIRTPTVMKGYHKNEKATKESITEDGFYKTGDLGYYKTGGGLYITERIKELIKVKGMQVAPAELESLLRSHPAVLDAAVVGVPHEKSGEVPKAFIIKKVGVNVNEEELKEFVAKKVAAFKKVEEIKFIKEIPKNASGKILRRELKNM